MGSILFLPIRSLFIIIGLGTLFCYKDDSARVKIDFINVLVPVIAIVVAAVARNGLNDRRRYCLLDWTTKTTTDIHVTLGVISYNQSFCCMILKNVLTSFSYKIKIKILPID